VFFFLAKFFHEAKQHEQCMINDLRKAEKLLLRKDAHANIHSEIASELLLEMKVFSAQ